jgi:hypothetical protein
MTITRVAGTALDALGTEVSATDAGDAVGVRNTEWDDAASGAAAFAPRGTGRTVSRAAFGVAVIGVADATTAKSSRAIVAVSTRTGNAITIPGAVETGSAITIVARATLDIEALSVAAIA